MKKLFCILILVHFVFFNIWSQVSDDKMVSDLKKNIGFLASDSLKGRKPGTPEDKVVASFIENKLKLPGFKVSVQDFELVTGAKLGTTNTLSVGPIKLQVKRDFIPYAISSNAHINAPVVFVGYGLEINTDSLKWSDYNGVNVKGCWALILKGEPATGKQADKYEKYSDDLSKILLAKDKGAIGVLFVSGVNFDKDDALPELRYEKNMNDVGIPVVHLARGTADLILAIRTESVAGLEKQIMTGKTSKSFETNSGIEINTDVIFEKTITHNVIALITGSDKKLKNEYIVVGAHMDHLGFGGPGSGSRRPDVHAIHNGADDNASGVGGIIELAKMLSKNRDSLKRSIFIVAFGGEEFGLIGSKAFVKNPPVELSKIVAMFNFDMIGRLDSTTKNLTIGGTGTSREGDSILKVHEKGYPFHFGFSTEGYGPSDHASFYLSNIPVFYFTTGAHEDYHTPLDQADRINYRGEENVVRYAYDVLWDVANRSADLTFHESGPKSEPRYGSRLKVRLGIMPDFASSSNEGLRVDAITPGGPAFHGGMLKGDVIVAMDGKEVKNIYDYMNRLEKVEHGQLLNVDILRAGKKMVLLIQL